MVGDPLDLCARIDGQPPERGLCLGPGRQAATAALGQHLPIPAQVVRREGLAANSAKAGEQDLAGQQGIDLAAQPLSQGGVAVVLDTDADFAAQILVLADLARMVGLEPVASTAPAQWPEERGFGDIAPGVVTGVQRLVVADTGDALVAEVQRVVNLQSRSAQGAPDLGQPAQAAVVAVESPRPNVVAGIVFGAVVVPEAEIVAAVAVVD